MEYWNELITEKSWKLLQEIKGKFNFLLIGGWANYLWTKQLKSKDIDIVVDFSILDELKKNYDLRKNDNLKKYEIKLNEIDIDIYVIHYSKLALPIEKLRATQIEGFNVVKAEDLLILKQGAYLDRKESEKGEKDRLDILGLIFFCDINFKDYFSLLANNNKKEYSDVLIKILKDSQDFQYFSLTPREFKLKKAKILENLRKA